MAVWLKALLAGILVSLVVALGMFLPAGTTAWPAGWVFLVLFCSFILAIGLMLWRHNPDLLAERVTVSNSTQTGWDKAFFPVFQCAFFAWLVLLPLDAVRWHWSQMPGWIQAAGATALLCSLALIYRTFRENAYLSPIVRTQEDHGQAVVSTGLYRWVRHPLYTGTSLMFPSAALLLGSWWGLAASPVLIGMLALRAVMEERMLRENLSGYDAYMTQVRYRLIPHIW